MSGPLAELNRVGGGRQPMATSHETISACVHRLYAMLFRDCSWAERAGGPPSIMATDDDLAVINVRLDAAARADAGGRGASTRQSSASRRRDASQPHDWPLRVAGYARSGRCLGSRYSGIVSGGGRP